MLSLAVLVLLIVQISVVTNAYLSSGFVTSTVILYLIWLLIPPKVKIGMLEALSSSFKEEKEKDLDN